MRRWLPLIIVCFLIGIIAVVILTTGNPGRQTFDQRVTMKQNDKIPYGTSGIRSMLPALFSGSDVVFENEKPGNWDSIIATSYNQAVVMVSNYFNADLDELGELLRFAEKGNYVYIIAQSFSPDARRLFNFAEDGVDARGPFSDYDTLSLRLVPPVFPSDSAYSHPVLRFESWFTALDTNYAAVLGRNKRGHANFIRLNRGSGAVFIHAAPLAFSNYFLLQRNNHRYAAQALSVIPGTVDKISWNEFYLSKPQSSRSSNEDEEEKEPGWLSVLFRYPAFKWGLITAVATGVLLVLLGMRRRQRMIPAYAKPANESLDFVRTMGRLYFDRRNHHNLARKMAQYFLEHVRTQFKLPTHSLDAEFVRLLSFKSGYSEEQLMKIVGFIGKLATTSSINESQLSLFHQQLEAFYQNT